MRRILWFIIFIGTLASLVFIFKDKLIPIFFSPTSSNVSLGVTEVKSDKDITIIAENLEIPWEIAFLPNSELLVTQRPGSLIKIASQNKIIPVSGVEHAGEGGLLGLALHPNFSENNWIYLYFTSKENGEISNRVERYVFVNDNLSQKKVIISKIKGASYHDGGRIAFGPDNLLYITTGDSGQPDLAQDTNSLNGKILRLNPDGSIPADNPFSNAVYSYGLRNPQGLAWDSQGKLWVTDHGPSGLQSGYDELNLIQKGKNYGWPDIKGDQSQANMVSPFIQSGSQDTWAPSGATFLEDSIFFAGLRGEALYQVDINTNNPSIKAHFKKEFGRLRTVTFGPSGFLYVLTNNTDGRGKEQKSDDKILRIDPKILE